MPRDGGQLRLYPFPQSSSLDIDPIHDRLVLFTSRTMLHRVLPSQKERYCFTIWISQRNDSMSFNSRAMVMNEREAARAALMGVKDSKNRNELWEILRMEEVRKHAIKWVFREEWLASLIQSHPSGKEQTALIDRFKNEITVVEQALRPLLPILEEWRSVSGRKNGSMPRSPYPAAQWL